MLCHNVFFRGAMSLFDKLAKIEALIQQSSSAGERQAALLAKERVLSSFSERQSNLPIEYVVTTNSPWKKRLFVALCNKYGFKTYRYQRQKYTTTRLRISKNTMNDVLWPEFERYAKILETLVEEIMQDLTNKIYEVKEEEVVIAGEISHQGGAGDLA
jgi:hypothetical protein